MKKKDNHKQGIVDFWTPAHITVGMVARYYGLSAKHTFVAACLFEVVENVFAVTPAAHAITELSGPETLTNAVGDVGFNMTGWLITDRLMKRWGA